MRIGIIGAGLTGLSAGLALSKNHEVVIFEKNSSAGGCMVSKKYERYELETLYHHCFSGDTALFDLLESINLKNDLVWLKGSTGYYMDGKLHPLTTPLEILRWPCLSFLQKARLGFFVISSILGGLQVHIGLLHLHFCASNLNSFFTILSSKE